MGLFFRARAAAAVAALASAAAISKAPPADGRPWLIFALFDDLGWANVGLNRADGSAEVVTPHIDRLGRRGVVLERHYAHFTCSPSRSAFLSGRAPLHVNMVNGMPTMHNPEEPSGLGFAGIPLGMTTVADKLREAGYRTHHVGKWDVSGLFTFPRS